MRFDSLVLAFCDRFLAQRTFDLIVAPALADLEAEDAGGRRSRIAIRAAVLRAMIGGWRHDLVRGSDTFLQLALLSACYYVFPVAVSVRSLPPNEAPMRGSKDHTTVMHAVKKITNLLSERRATYTQVTELTARIKSRARQ